MKSYLPKKYQIIFLIILFFLWIFDGPLLWPLLLGGGVFLSFRQKWISLKKTTDTALYAPVSGKVDSIFKKDEFTEVNIVIPWWKGMGVCLPFASEVKNKTTQEKRVTSHYPFFQKKRIIHLSLKGSGNDQKISLVFYGCSLGGRVYIDVEPGDRGKGGCSIGFFPLGGKVKLFLPASYQILTRRREILSAGQTSLALWQPHKSD